MRRQRFGSLLSELEIRAAPVELFYFMCGTSSLMYDNSTDRKVDHAVQLYKRIIVVS